MTSSGKPNLLVMQSGGCTPVLNRSLFGIVNEATNSERFDRILGAAHGIPGVLSEDLIDLTRPSKSQWNSIARAPGAALGSTRRKLTADDVPVIVEVLKRLNIRFWFIIGGNDSAETGQSISDEANTAGWPLTVMNVPKTIDNDLVLTDHSPGYGSAARFVAMATMGAGRDAEAMGEASPVAVIEVMGRDAGWLAASAALAKQDDRDAPHVICVPEVPVDEERFVDRVGDAYEHHGFAVAVIAENTRGARGVLGGDQEPWFVDDFGHPYYDGPGRYLAALVSRRLRVRARYEKPGTIQRSMMACVSRPDAEEAEAVGRAAVQYALDGHADEIVTLVRRAGGRYGCTTGVAPLGEVAGAVFAMPDDYLDREKLFVSPAFVKYARPLIGSALPRLDRLR